MAMGALVTLAFTGVTAGAAAIAVAILYGFALRGEGSLLNIILAQYYARESFGTIAGFVSPIQMIGLSIGHAAAALAFEATGSYNIVFVNSAALLASAALGYGWRGGPHYRRSSRPLPPDRSWRKLVGWDGGGSGIRTREGAHHPQPA